MPAAAAAVGVVEERERAKAEQERGGRKALAPLGPLVVGVAIPVLVVTAAAAAAVGVAVRTGEMGVTTGVLLLLPPLAVLLLV